MSQLRSHRDWFERDPKYAAVPREIRPAGNTGVSLIRAQQPAGHFARGGAPEFLLSLLERGGGRTKVTFGGDEIESPSRPGDCIVAPADTSLGFEHEAAPDLLIFVLPDKAVRDVLAEHGRHVREVSFGRLHAGLFRDDLVAALSHRLWHEAAGGDPLSGLFVDQGVRTLMLALFRAAGERLPATPPEKGGLAPWQARRACDYLRAHLGDDMGLDQLAGLVGLSPAHFCRAFKQSTGLPPHRWQLARRVERAQELLTGTGLSVIEVAAQVGYEDPNQLARVFRKHLGTSPSR